MSEDSEPTEEVAIPSIKPNRGKRRTKQQIAEDEDESGLPRSKRDSFRKMTYTRSYGFIEFLPLNIPIGSVDDPTVPTYRAPCTVRIRGSSDTAIKNRIVDLFTGESAGRDKGPASVAKKIGQVMHLLDETLKSQNIVSANSDELSAHFAEALKKCQRPTLVKRLPIALCDQVIEAQQQDNPRT